MFHFMPFHLLLFVDKLQGLEFIIHYIFCENSTWTLQSMGTKVRDTRLASLLTKMTCWVYPVPENLLYVLLYLLFGASKAAQS